MAFGDTLPTTALDADSDSTTGSGNGRDQLLAAVNEVNFILSQFAAGSTPVTTANLVALNVALTNATNTFSEDQLIQKVLPNLLLRTANPSDQSFIKTFDDAGVTRAELRVDAFASETIVYLLCKEFGTGLARSWIELNALGNVNLETSLSGIATVNSNKIIDRSDFYTVTLNNVLNNTTRTIDTGFGSAPFDWGFNGGKVANNTTPARAALIATDADSFAHRVEIGNSTYVDESIAATAAPAAGSVSFRFKSSDNGNHDINFWARKR